MASTTTALVAIMMILMTMISNYNTVVTAAVVCPTLDKCETPMKEFSELDPGSSIFRPCCDQIKQIPNSNLGECFCLALNTYILFEDPVSAEILNQFLNICGRSVPSTYVCAPLSD